MNVKPPAEVLKRPVCTWLKAADYAKFEALALRSGVTVSTYLRSIVVDALAEETVPVSVSEAETAIQNAEQRIYRELEGLADAPRSLRQR